MSIVKYKSFKHYWECQADCFDDELRAVLMQPEKYIGKAFLKYAPGEKTHVSLVNLSTQKIVVKKYNIISFWHGIKIIFKQTRAKRNWNYARKLAALNILVPKPIAMIENRWGIFPRESYFVYEYIAGVDGLELFQAGANNPFLAQYAKKIVTIIDDLAIHRITHGDLKASNFILAEGLAYLIDLDRMRFNKFNFSARRGNKEDRKRFMENWSNGPFLKLFSELLR